MKIEKLPSGSYRVRKMYQGIAYTAVFDYKPTQKEIVQALSVEMDKAKVSKQRLTFGAAAERYIENKSNVLSPSTIKGYTSLLSNLPLNFKKKFITDITAMDVQTVTNVHAKTHSPKTTRNMHGFITAVLGLYAPNTIINTTLPQKDVHSDYIPTDEDIKRILDYFKGTVYEIPITLAIFGLRRSEICALDIPNDLNGNMLTINKALVQGIDKQWVVKQTKTEAGTRTIYLPDSVVELLKDKRRAFDGHPGTILKGLKKAQEELGIPSFSLHKLRHYFASSSHALGVPDQYIMDAGGWKSKHVLGSIYQHAMQDKKKEMMKITADYYSSHLFS